MATHEANAGREPTFIGRIREMNAGRELAATRPGLLVVVGQPWIGTSRFMTEFARDLTADGAALVHLGLGPTLDDRLGKGLIGEELRFDPVDSARLRPFVALLDDLDDVRDDAFRIGKMLAGTPGLLVACAREIPMDGVFVELEPLDEADAQALVVEVMPAIDDLVLARVLELGAGRPAALVALARANRRAASGDGPIAIPPSLARALQPMLDAIDPAHLDVARWTAVIGGAFEPAHLVRLTGRTEPGLSPALDALTAAGILQGVPGPGQTRLCFGDPLVAACLAYATPPGELRRRHAAVLAARRERGDEPGALVDHAIGSSDPAQVVRLSLRAAGHARTRGNPASALIHASRALRWSERHRPESEYLEAMLEQGLALAGLGQWDQVPDVLGQVIRRQRRAGDEGAAVRAATEWARVRWYAGDRVGAFEMIEQNVEGGGGPLAERAKAMTQAAMFAANAGRHTEALAWAARAREEAMASEDHLTAILALNALGLATVRSTASSAGLTYFREALQQARADGLLRQEAVTLNNESVCLLMLGLVRQAADRAQQGLDVVEANGIAEVDAPLTHNLAEALSALGRIPGARRLAQRSRDAFVALGSHSNEHLDGVLAWLDFAEGKIDEALAALRVIAGDRDEETMIEHMGPLAAYHVHVAHAAGELDEARSVARSAIAHWQETEDRVDALGLLGAACEVLPADELAPVVAQLQAAADAGAPIAAALLQHARAWAAVTPEERVAAFREASARFAETGMVWWAARTLMLAGQAAPPQSQELADLLEARRMFREMEAPGWRGRCEAELRARGHKFVMTSRRRDAAHLTEREVEVLDQLAKGLTNQQISERLHITEKTVGHHLGSIFAKLGVVSRMAAVSAGLEGGLIADALDQLSTASGELSTVRKADTVTPT